MRNRTIMRILALLALLLWTGLLIFMHRQPPTPDHQFTFTLVWAGAIFCSVMPISYGLNARFSLSLGRIGDLSRALRQGLEACILGGVLMGLHLLHMLTSITVIILCLSVALLETLSYLKRR